MCRACTVFVQSVRLLRSAPYSLMIVSVLAKPETIRDVPCWPSAQTPSPSIERVMPGYAASAVRGPRKARGRAFHVKAWGYAQARATGCEQFREVRAGRAGIPWMTQVIATFTLSLLHTAAIGRLGNPRLSFYARRRRIGSS